MERARPIQLLFLNRQKSTFLAKKDGFNEQADRFVPVILLHVEEARARAGE